MAKILITGGAGYIGSHTALDVYKRQGLRESIQNSMNLRLLTAQTGSSSFDI